MGRGVARKLIDAHLVEGEMAPGGVIGLSVDQTLTQDATGTPVMQELEALGLDRTRAGVSVQYVDHNLLQTAATDAGGDPAQAMLVTLWNVAMAGGGVVGGILLSVLGFSAFPWSVLLLLLPVLLIVFVARVHGFPAKSAEKVA
jgi:hypothetical protein